MKLTLPERCILLNQLHILSFLDPENKRSYENDITILEEGYELLYNEILPFDDIMSSDKSRLVLDILSMFRAIKQSLAKFDNKTGIDLEQLEFVGFDANDEGQYYSFADFYCKKFMGGRFTELWEDGKDLNSHHPVLDTYSRMVEAWKKSASANLLTKADLIRIAESAIHPTQRKKQ